jgi:hypothetical protein
MYIISNRLLSLLLALTISINTFSQDVVFNTGVDLYSTYMFRGKAFDGPSLQPSIEMSKNGFILGAWGSQGFSNSLYRLEYDTLEVSKPFQEMDLYAGFEFSNGLYLGVTDYYYPGSAWGASDSHAFEINASYSVSSINLSGNYILNGAVDAGSKGNDMYYEIGYSLEQADLFIGVGDGWHSTTSNFAVVNVGIMTSNIFEITDSFSIPINGSIVLNPDTEQFYILVGFSF